MEKVQFSKLYKQSYAMTESLRVLKTNIRFCGEDKKVIVLTSSIPNEGKSVVAMNLARSISESGNTVLMIDTDMRNSVMINRFGVRASSGNTTICGLSHFLTGQKELVDVIYETDQKNMHVIFSGPQVPNPTEILENDHFSQLITVARRVYDYVIIDSAPINLTIDAAVVAKYCDGIILVVAQNMATSRMVKGAIRQLEMTGTPILGAVLNKYVEEKHGYGSYGGYYGSYYGEYGQYGQKKKDKKKK